MRTAARGAGSQEVRAREGAGGPPPGGSRGYLQSAVES